MTKVVYKKNKKSFDFVKINGHANFSKKGKDIVCAGISSVVEGSSSFLKKKYNDLVSIEMNDAEVVFIPLKFSHEVSLCLEMMIYQLANIENFYPNYLKIKNLSL
ncbi:MAG: hypothetical protein AD073_000168 [Mycoplasmataceae bacterium]|nr:MAG: hypothetical protein AD073_000168 [Mycoplasmataceae bacterium]